MQRLVLLPLILAACGLPRDLEADEIAAWEVERPAHARPGMFMTWRLEDALGDEETVVEKTVACVASDTMEWRETRADGRVTVIAARYAPDGRILGAWRGPSDGVGVPLRVVAEDPIDPKEAENEADRVGRPLGISTEDAEATSSRVRETIETPAGRFHCVRDRTEVKVLFASGTMTMWFCEDPLPLDPMVRLEHKGPLSYYLLQELISYGTTGAQPTLAIPRN